MLCFFFLSRLNVFFFGKIGNNKTLEINKIFDIFSVKKTFFFVLHIRIKISKKNNLTKFHNFILIFDTCDIVFKRQ